jgi:hypothetical protein
LSAEGREENHQATQNTKRRLASEDLPQVDRFFLKNIKTENQISTRHLLDQQPLGALGGLVVLSLHFRLATFDHPISLDRQRHLRQLIVRLHRQGAAKIRH